MFIDGYHVALVDEGTMDTVIEIEGKFRVRFECEYASQYRDVDGCLTEEGLRELGAEALEDYLVDQGGN
jgi:hypothetical protein